MNDSKLALQSGDCVHGMLPLTKSSCRITRLNYTAFVDSLVSHRPLNGNLIFFWPFRLASDFTMATFLTSERSRNFPVALALSCQPLCSERTRHHVGIGLIRLCQLPFLYFCIVSEAEAWEYFCIFSNVCIESTTLVSHLVFCLLDLLDSLLFSLSLICLVVSEE